MDTKEERLRREFIRRLAEAMQSEGINQAELGRRVGASSATVSEWFSKHALPEGTKMLLIPKAVGASGHWLLTGTGSPIPTDTGGTDVLRRGVNLALGRMSDFIDQERVYFGANAEGVSADVRGTDRLARPSEGSRRQGSR